MSEILDFYASEFDSEYLGLELREKKQPGGITFDDVVVALGEIPAYLEGFGTTDESKWITSAEHLHPIPATNETIALAHRAIRCLAESEAINLASSEDYHRAARGVAATAVELGGEHDFYMNFDSVCAKFAGYDVDDNRRKFERYRKAALEKTQHIGPRWLFSVTGLYGELAELIADYYECYHEYYEQKGKLEDKTKPETASFEAEQLPPFDQLRVKQRPTVFGPYLLRRAITLLGGAGGTGKSVFSLTLAVSMAIGRDLLGLNGGEHQKRPKRVLVLNNEDDDEELVRRLAAVVQHHTVTPKEYELAQRNLFFRSGTAEPVKIALRPKADPRNLREAPWVARLQEFCLMKRIDAVFADPLVCLHDAQENDNVEMDTVMQIAKQLASVTNVAILLIHHTRKESSINADDAFRGASAVVNAARIVIRLSRMTNDEAKKLELCGDERTRFFRVDFGKQNYNLSPEETPWFRNASVLLPTDAPANSDQGSEHVAVGVPEPVALAPIESEKSSTTSALEFLQALHDATWPARLKDYYPILQAVCGVKTARSVQRHLETVFPTINEPDKSDAAIVILKGYRYQCWIEMPSRAAGLWLHRQKV